MCLEPPSAPPPPPGTAHSLAAGEEEGLPACLRVTNLVSQLEGDVPPTLCLYNRGPRPETLLPGACRPRRCRRWERAGSARSHPAPACPCGESAALGLVLFVDSATGQSLHQEARLGQR